MRFSYALELEAFGIHRCRLAQKQKNWICILQKIRGCQNFLIEAVSSWPSCPTFHSAHCRQLDWENSQAIVRRQERSTWHFGVTGLSGPGRPFLLLFYLEKKSAEVEEASFSEMVERTKTLGRFQQNVIVF